jgi:acyl carrier protein
MPESESPPLPAEAAPAAPGVAAAPEDDALAVRVQAILARRLGVALPGPDADLIDGGLIDSLTLVELLFELEREFELQFSLDDLDVETFRSVDRIAAFVRAQRSRSAR